MAGLINLVATMQGWKRKNRLEVLEKIGAAGMSRARWMPRPYQTASGSPNTVHL
ncbi:hypothetical protein Tco_1435455, partial [Tanacetum coccineum]